MPWDNFPLRSGNRHDHPFRGQVPTASSGRFQHMRRRESEQSRVVSAELIGGIGSFRNATPAASGRHFPGMLSARLKLAPSLRPTDLVDNMDVEDHATERARGAMEPAVHQQQHPRKKKASTGASSLSEGTRTGAPPASPSRPGSDRTCCRWSWPPCGLPRRQRSNTVTSLKALTFQLDVCHTCHGK